MPKAVVSMTSLFVGYLDKSSSVTMLFWGQFDRKASGEYTNPPSIAAQVAGPWTSWEPQYWFTITPEPHPPGAEFLVPFDQQVGITNVSWILKGEAHELDATGGAGDLVLEITVTNYRNDAPAYFQVWKLRADYDLNR